MEPTLMATKERMIEELTKFHLPNMTEEQAEKVVEELSSDYGFWNDFEQKFHEESARILKRNASEVE